MIWGRCALVAALIMATAPSASAADGAGVADSLPAQVIRFHPHDHSLFLEAVARSRTGSDSLDRRAADLITSSLSWLEGECRATLLSKDAEPGSPWLLWRSRGRVELDSCVWYAGADAGADVRGDLVVTADAVQFNHAVEEWSESPDADPAKTKKAVTAGTVRFEYRPKTRRFVRVK
jgi:hypothetical protein